MKKKVVFSFLATERDKLPDILKNRKERWGKYRPNISICRAEGFPVSRLILLRSRKAEHVALAEEVKQDIGIISPDTNVEIRDFPLEGERAPWELATVYDRLLEIVSSFDFRQDKEDYFFYSNPGSHIMKMCIMLFVDSGIFPGKLVQTFEITDENFRYDEQDRQRYHVETIDLHEARYDKAMARLKILDSPSEKLRHGLKVQNKALEDMLNELELVCMNSNRPILLSGPYGIGKTQLVKLIDECKRMRNRDLGELNPITCTNGKFITKKGQSEEWAKVFFDSSRKKKIGILFLDNVEELDQCAQAMLSDSLDAPALAGFTQLVCATSCDLQERVRQGTFQADLFSRISHWSYRLPGIAERPEDMEALIEEAFQKLPKIRFTPEAKKLLLKKAHSRNALWENNFRDLEQLADRMALLSKDGVITCELVQTEWKKLSQKWQGAPAPSSRGCQENFRDTEDRSLLEKVMGERAFDIELIDLPQLARAIRACRASKSRAEAGRILFDKAHTGGKTVNHSDKLKKYLERFDLDWEMVTRG